MRKYKSIRTKSVWIALFWSATLPAQAADAIETACKAEFSAKECSCASKRTNAFFGDDFYGRYATFFAIFSERAANATTSGEILGNWTSSQGAYSKQSGEDHFDVTGWIRGAEAVHRYALKACGILLTEEQKETSLFFWGETL